MQTLSTQALAALKESMNWRDSTPYCFSSERVGRRKYLEEVVLAEDPNREAILTELGPVMIGWSVYAGD